MAPAEALGAGAAAAEKFCATLAAPPDLSPFVRRHRAFRSGAGAASERAKEALSKMKGVVREVNLRLAPLCEKIRAFEEADVPKMEQFQRTAEEGFVDCSLLLRDETSGPRRKVVPAPALSGTPPPFAPPAHNEGFLGLSEVAGPMRGGSGWAPLRQQISSLQESYDDLTALLDSEKRATARIFQGSGGARSLLDEEARFFAPDGALGDRLGALREYLAQKKSELDEIHRISRALLPKEEKFCAVRPRGNRGAGPFSADDAQNTVNAPSLDPGGSGTAGKNPGGGKKARPK